MGASRGMLPTDVPVYALRFCPSLSYFLLYLRHIWSLVLGFLSVFTVYTCFDLRLRKMRRITTLAEYNVLMFTCLRHNSFNVLNYFTTLNSRGANTEEEREDQLAKITQGALALNADVIGIIEVRLVL